MFLSDSISDMDEKGKKVLNSLEAQCSKREYCRKDILAKALKALEVDAAAADEVVASLVKDRFVDDARYAGAFARQKAHLDGWGPVKIRYSLRAKGVDGSVIDEALSSLDPERAGAKLEKLLDAKAKSLEGDPQKNLKLIKYALSRGYDYDQVRDYISLH